MTLGMRRGRTEHNYIHVCIYRHVPKSWLILRIKVSLHNLKWKFSSMSRSKNSRVLGTNLYNCLLYTSPSPRDATLSRMPSSA